MWIWEYLNKKKIKHFGHWMVQVELENSANVADVAVS